MKTFHHDDTRLDTLDCGGTILEANPCPPHPIEVQMINVPFGFKHASMFRGGSWRAGRALLASFLLFSIPVVAQPGTINTADPYFTPTAAKST